MGAKHSKRSMDVTTTPKKEGLPAEGANAPVVCEGKLERIEETDAKPTTNGVAPHTDVPEEKDAKDKDITTEKEKEQSQDEETKVTAEETSAETPAESPAENTGEVTTPTETPAAPTSVTSPDSKESKKKDKKKKWSFRSISFSKKDKNKPVREDSSKNGDVSKEEPLSEGGEEAENATSPADDKSAVSSPTTESAAAAAVEAKEEEPEEKSVEPTAEEKPSEPAAPSSPADPTPVPVVDDANKEEVEKIVEVSRVEELKTAAAPVEITKPKSPPIVAPSIIERKTSEDFPSLLPSSPPPTPIDPSPLQQAQQAAANATALAEALKLPAEATQSLNTAQQLEKSLSDSVKPVETSIVDIQVEEIETLPVLQDQDIVIETEEGPVPISSDIKVEIIEPQVLQEEKHLVDDEEKDEVIVISDISLSGTVNEQDNDAATEIAITEIPEDESLSIDKTEEEIPPPLPDSPIPVPKASVDLLNFMTSQIDDVISSEENVILPANNHEEDVKSEVTLSEELPPPSVDVSMPDNTADSVTKSPIESLLTPPRSPSPLAELNGHDSVQQNINSYNDCKLERLNETFSEEITPNDHSLKHNMQTIDQSIAEPETPVENNQVTNDSTTENIEEAPKCPSVTAEAPVITSSPPVGPAITEDVASVTKAIEEIDINEKAVAMAVNENIESINTNEIIADMNHQNSLKE